jgi:hypothetical protein
MSSASATPLVLAFDYQRGDFELTLREAGAGRLLRNDLSGVVANGDGDGPVVARTNHVHLPAAAIGGILDPAGDTRAGRLAGLFSGDERLERRFPKRREHGGETLAAHQQHAGARRDMHRRRRPIETDEGHVVANQNLEFGMPRFDVVCHAQFGDLRFGGVVHGAAPLVRQVSVGTSTTFQGRCAGGLQFDDLG